MRYSLLSALLALSATAAQAQSRPPAPPPPREPLPEAPAAIFAPGVEASLLGVRADSARATLGMVVEATGTKRDTLGMFIASVAKEGPAEQAGIYEGQRVAAINGVDLRVSAADLGDDFAGTIAMHRLMRAMEKVQPGGKVELRVYADGRMKTVEIKAARFLDVFKGEMPALNLLERRIELGGLPAAGMLRLDIAPPGALGGAARVEMVPVPKGELAPNAADVFLEPGAPRPAHVKAMAPLPRTGMRMRITPSMLEGRTIRMAI